MSDDISYIYALCYPSNNIRYIGVSKNPEKRFRQHINPSNLKNKTHKNDWIKSLLSQNLIPELLIIESVVYEEHQEREKFWIQYYKNNGCDLVNGTEGGDGMQTPSQSTRDKMVANATGNKNMLGKRHSNKTKRLISDANKGKKMSQEAKEKISNFNKGKIISEEHKKILSEKMKGNENSRGFKKEGSSSKYIGVSWDGSRKKWQSRINFGGKTVHIGRFETEIEAAIAYNKVAVSLLGEDAKINIIL